MEPSSKSQLIGIVGPCGAGKSTLTESLEKNGYACRHIAQEHSYVPAMWQIITKPGLLIYLNVSFPISTARTKLNWQEKDYTEQLHRLSHAREHAHIIIDTDNMTTDEVLQKVLTFLKDYFS
ncbi:MAG TPA: AAA family ATPase [Anaerolineales bacterium]|nr:AAA family ATPase [Anaerolineales bacterium]